ncbi:MULTISPECIES: hypothetical protein [Nocardiaceae]|uniref:Acyl-CoA reductase-like NAD-dependent aldehyde dehydrogenase n=1 Tax=Rhodococcoides corynebacterioides TaxID=53972 RepID=A0ABS2KNT4_9NOCA|nr:MULTISPECIES: hypothetical protein [Rhodococcus]MBM7413548.1 acyl-CoA reductase-like NAD-dependent aldehyde dehydrogenase [Rhodococcus corynebacterioides]MBP1116011.1 acyl-CoA reductase-like NAD-dependent aldehyde dehydrogenase [Rhodococcus sp. PvP016]
MTTYDGFDTLPIAGQWRVGRDGRTADDVNPYSGDVLTNSGIGRFGGEWAIDEFTTNHWISVQHTPRQYAI